MKKLIIVVIVLVLIGLAFPVSNLIITPSAAVEFPGDDPEGVQVSEILGKKCAFCHMEEAPMPFYASFPVASTMIQKDVAQGVAWFDIDRDLFPGGKGPASEVGIAKLVYSVEMGEMPPGKFKALHWNTGLGEEETSAILAWASQGHETYVTPGVADAHKGSPLQPLPAPETLDEKKVALGNKLFHDVRLSGDDTISCASCHDLGMGGTDQAQFSTGVGGAMGDINAPTVYNSGYQVLQFWDGRAADLVEQAAGPVTNPIEMAAEWTDVIAKLEKDAEFMAEFKGSYPDGPSLETITDAIAIFEKTLVTPSAFDRYLRGETHAIGADEIAGHEIFVDLGCATCHVGKILGGQSFERMGIKEEYFAEPEKRDNGRFNVTGDERDRHRLKVPTLRNIALTFPYFHDGSTGDLAEAVKTMGRVQLGQDLPDEKVDRIVKFLHTLTGVE